MNKYYLFKMSIERGSGTRPAESWTITFWYRLLLIAQVPFRYAEVKKVQTVEAIRFV
jgi:hypothetical protein